MKNRILSTIISLAMIVTMAPTIAFAAESGSDNQVQLQNPSVVSGETIWDCIYFGSYPQSYADYNYDYGCYELNWGPIKWRVLDVSDTNGDGIVDDAFLLSDKILDGKKYDEYARRVAWSECTLRDWLNDDFVESAFSYTEREAIKHTKAVNYDEVFLLSENEAKTPRYGFTAKNGKTDTRVARRTDYAYENYAYKEWWLRSSHNHKSYWDYYVGFVFEEGEVGEHSCTDCTEGVRPALHINLQSSCWSYAGACDSHGNEGARITSATIPANTYAYTGNAITPEPTVKCEGAVLEKDKDYTVEYRNNVHAGTAKVIIRGKGDYLETLTITKTFEIKGPSYSKDGVKLQNPVKSNGVSTWDCIYFGRYPQSDRTGATKEPIKWRVLELSDTNHDGMADDAFILANRELDAKPYNTTYDDVTWETCTLRSWLNGYGPSKNSNGKDYSSSNFINKAFNVAEQNAIRTTEVANNDNADYDTEGGNDTTDKIYLLSSEEAREPSFGFISGYGNKKTRIAQTTVYAEKNLAFTWLSEGSFNSNGASDYWLRSPGGYTDYAACVDYYGNVHNYGFGVDTTDSAVRPALHINLQSSNWSYAGKVTSKSIANAKVTIANTPLTYNGLFRKPTVSIKIDGTTLKKGTDYTVEYRNNKKVGGIAAVRISIDGLYTGTIIKTFKINPKGTSIKKVSAQEKGFTVKWAKQSAKMSTSRITGYQIRYSTKSSMAGAKIKTIKGYKNTSKKITTLKANKKYYVQVRTYKRINQEYDNKWGIYRNNKAYYSKWSAKKTVRTE